MRTGVHIATYIALLRCINVGGNKPVCMTALRELLTDLAFGDVKTLLNSGNAVFTAPKRSTAALEKLLAAETKKRLGVECDFFIYTTDEWSSMIARNPLAEDARRDSSHLIVMCLRDAPSASGMKTLEKTALATEIVRANGKQIYIVYRVGIGRSKLSGALIERVLATRGTGRNWNTVLKLAKAAGAK